jgi:crossover junction endodeoxyribonuclease RuvC
LEGRNVSRVYVGIDPGNTGALACVDIEDQMAMIVDTPTMSFVSSSKKNRTVISEDGIAEIMDGIVIAAKVHGRKLFAAIERAQAMPKQGVSSSFNYGTGYGMWLGVLAAHKIPRVKVSPAEWMKTMFVNQGTRDKDVSIKVARELFPMAELSLKKHHGRAEALLIAEWARRNHP